MRLPFNQGSDAWLTELAALPLVHQPGDRVTYSHSIDLLGVIVSRIEDKPFHQVLDERILGPAGMPDTGFFVSAETRHRAATMYRLDEENQLRHDVMGPPHIKPPAFCNAGGGLWSTADDYLRFVRMLLGGGTIDGVRVLSTSRAPDAHRPAQRRAEAASVPGGAVLGRPRIRAEPLGGDRSGEIRADVRAGRAWDVQLARGLRDLVAGGPGRNDLILLYLIQNCPDLSRGRGHGRRGQHVAAKLRTAQPKFVRNTYRALGF